jgi:ribosomal protein S18 acetylase RimI-like enzyme
VRIRPAEPDELALVGEMTLAAYVADGHTTVDDSYADELRAADQRAQQAQLVVAAAPHGDLLGTVTFVLPGTPWAEVSRPGEAEFRMLAVPPEHRGRGVGSALAQWCVDRAREQGCTAVALSTLPEMATAHRMYERMGFARAPERDWWPNPQVELIVYLLELV